MSTSLDPLLSRSQLDRGTLKQQSTWKRRAIDAVLVSVAVISLAAMAVRLLAR
ncbi:MAG TPA: hypothetical protein VL156_01220 [Terriglobales bacterium]|nr:hypothetical protein [Terriglobales bacterium]